MLGKLVDEPRVGCFNSRKVEFKDRGARGWCGNTSGLYAR